MRLSIGKAVRNTDFEFTFAVGMCSHTDLQNPIGKQLIPHSIPRILGMHFNQFLYRAFWLALATPPPFPAFTELDYLTVWSGSKDVRWASHHSAVRKVRKIHHALRCATVLARSSRAATSR